MFYAIKIKKYLGRRIFFKSIFVNCKLAVHIGDYFETLSRDRKYN